MQRIFQSDPRAAFRRVFFTCVDAAALQTRLQSSDMSTFGLRLSKNGASGSSGAAAPTQVDATNAKGLFYVELALADIDTAGPCALVVTNSGGTKTMEPREIPFYVEQAVLATALTGALGATAFTTTLTSTVDNAHSDLFVHFLTGALAGQTKKIGTYTGSSKLVSLASGLAFTAAPANGDVFELINR